MCVSVNVSVQVCVCALGRYTLMGEILELCAQKTIINMLITEPQWTMINILKYNKIVFGLWEQLPKRGVAGSHHTSSIHTICQPDYRPSGQTYPTLQSLWHRQAHGHIWAVNCHWPLSTHGLLLSLSFWKARSCGHSLCPTLHPMVLLLGLLLLWGRGAHSQGLPPHPPFVLLVNW